MATKQAKVEHPVHELIAKRWSPRAFSDRQIEPDKLLSLLEAARWGASCFNEQPWRFIVATKKQGETFDKLVSCLAEANQTWAQNASALMLSVAKLHFDRNGKPNRHAFHDVGLAVANLCLQATALDIYVHQMAGFNVTRARTLFEIPASHEPVAAIALGYLGDPQTLPDNLREREHAERTRRSLREIIFGESWGDPSELLRRS